MLVCRGRFSKQSCAFIWSRLFLDISQNGIFFPFRSLPLLGVKGLSRKSMNKPSGSELESIFWSRSDQTAPQCEGGRRLAG